MQTCSQAPRKPLPTGTAGEDIYQKGKRGMALRISGAVGLGDVHRDICWMQGCVK